MKKVMTALATAATALLAFGDVQSVQTGTSFEDLAVGPKTVGALTTTTDGGVEQQADRYWFSTAAETDELGAITNEAPYTGNMRPDAFSGDNFKYLTIDTSTPIYRTVSEVSSATAVSGLTGVSMATGDGLYLDTLVKFTAADQVFGDDALSDGDKIAIEYVATDDASNPITNFVIRAGYFGSEEFTTTNYYAAVPQGFDVGEWHRLTVRALASIDEANDTGFVVYLDNQPLVYDTTKTTACGDDFTATGAAVNFYKSDCYALYPSAVQTGVYKTTLAAVAFQGNGAIDDISFTSTTPQFIAASETIPLTINLGNGVTAVTVTVAGGTIQGNNGVYALPAGTPSFTLGYTLETGYTFDGIEGGTYNEGTVTWTDAAPVITVKATRQNFAYTGANGATTVATLAEAFAGAVSGSTITLAYDYNVGLWGEGFYTISGKEVVLDLAGHAFTCTATDGDAQFTVSAGAKLTIIDSIGGGSINYSANYAIALIDGDLYIGAASGDAGVTINGCLYNSDSSSDATVVKGSFDSASNSKNDAFAWPLAEGSSASQNGNYWVVAPTVTWATLLGEAIAENTYGIDNLTELKAFQANIASTTNELKLATAGVTFKLTADIALDAAWPGIGVQNGKDIYSTEAFNAAAFCGTFDGQNHTISGFQMVNGLDYCGFFNSIYGATIQNLKISYAGNLFTAGTVQNSDECGATFVGVAKNSTLFNLTTVAGTVSCSKGFGGIVGYLIAGTTVDSCTNNVNLTSLKPNKAGGIAMITQNGAGKAIIRNCQNNGTIAGSNETGSLIGYVSAPTTTVENCESTVAYKLFHHQSNVVEIQGVTAVASVDPYTGAATPGLNFATVDGSVATFVADEALAAGNTYKAMHAATATFVFAEAGTIAFDTALATPTYAITAAEGLDLSSATSGTVTTYTAAAQTTPVQPGGTDGATYTDAQTATNAAEKVVVSVPEAVTNAGVDATTYKAMFEAKVVNNDGTYSVVVDLKPAIEAEVQTAVNTATTTTLDAVLTADGAAKVSVTTKPGLYYQIVTSDTLPLPAPAADEWVLATGTESEITVAPPEGNAAFFKVYCTPAK